MTPPTEQNTAASCAQSARGYIAAGISNAASGISNVSQYFWPRAQDSVVPSMPLSETHRFPVVHYDESATTKGGSRIIRRSPAGGKPAKRGVMDAHSAKRSDESEQEQPRSRLELSKKKNGAADMTTAFGGGSSNGSPDNVGHLWSDHDTENDAPWFGSDCATKNDAPWFGDSDNDDCRRVEANSKRGKPLTGNSHRTGQALEIRRLRQQVKSMLPPPGDNRTYMTFEKTLLGDVRVRYNNGNVRIKNGQFDIHRNGEPDW